MTNSDNFWAGKQSAAVLKHGVLAGYLQPFATMTGSSAGDRTTWFIDAYAGPGRYEKIDGEHEGAPGSPLIALGIANNILRFKSPVHLRSVFIESNQVNAESLEQIIATGRFVGDPQVIRGRAEDQLALAVSKVKSDSLLTFLDPFGTALPYELMRDVLFGRKTTRPNEVLLNMHVTSIARIGSFLGRTDQLTAGDQKTLARLDAFLGGTNWREVFDSYYVPGQAGSATRAALEVTAAFRRQVMANTGYDSTAIDIRRAQHHVPIFQLTLFYRRPVAAYKFADAASMANAKWREFNMRTEAYKNGVQFEGALLGLDFSEKVFEEKWKEDEALLAATWVRQLVQQIRELLVSRDRLSVGAQVKEILGELMGLAGEKHIRSAWDYLAGQGEVVPRTKSERLHAGVIEIIRERLTA